MIHVRVRGALLRLYPPHWRARYGDELDDLMRQASGGRRLPLRIWQNVAFAAGRERLRASGLTGDALPPGERSRAGTLLVLCAWSLFVVAGVSVQKISEHWQDVTPASSRGVPSVAFDVLVGAAAVGSAAVLLGIACALPAFWALLLGGGWHSLRRPIRRAAGLTIVAAVATGGLLVWAHTLPAQQRDGHYLLYGLGALAWALVTVACLAAWTAAGVAAGSRIELSPGLLRLEAWLGVLSATTMVVMLAATCVWWAALANSAPWFFEGRSRGASASALSPELVGCVVLMVAATAGGLAGSLRAVRESAATRS
jgi:hypothetical protein